MAKKILNDEELFLLKNWADARLLETSLKKLRGDYKSILAKVLDEVHRKHAALDRRGIVLDIDEDNDRERDTSNLGLGKSTWPSSDKYVTGFGLMAFHWEK